MSTAFLEHVNVTVSDPQATAERLCSLFDWHIRWEGEAINNGYTIHVGTDTSYVAIYSRGNPDAPKNSYTTRGGLNHIGVVVDDLDLIEDRVKAAGLTPKSHADYEPGRRFYFNDPDGIEFEVINYS